MRYSTEFSPLVPHQFLRLKSIHAGPATRMEMGVPVCTALAADATASVHLQLWGPESEFLQPGDIIKLTNG